MNNFAWKCEWSVWKNGFYCMLCFYSPWTLCLVLPSSPFVRSPFVFLHSARVLAEQPLAWMLVQRMGLATPPPSGYRGVLGGVRRQDGSELAARGWWMVPFLLRLWVCVWPGGRSRPLSSAAVSSPAPPPERGLLWAGGSSSLWVVKGMTDFRGQT